MSCLVVAVLLIFAAVLVCGREIPRGFILDVKAECGPNRVANRPVLRVKSDLNLVVRAKCANGLKTFTSADKVNYALTGTFYRKSARKCLFFRRKNTDVYTTTVYVSYGDASSPLNTEPQAYTLTCAFSRRGAQSSKTITIGDAYSAPDELRSDAGRKTSSTLRLNVYNVNDRIITGNVVRGCRVYLAATTNGRNREVGLRPVACDAVSVNSGRRLPILRAGCSTNALWPFNAGFTTAGRRVRSPYFEMVQIEDDKQIAFECVFTLCPSNCNGSSCAGTKPRGKRSSDADLELVVRSEPMQVE